jgi:hypothetical protein
MMEELGDMLMHKMKFMTAGFAGRAFGHRASLLKGTAPVPVKSKLKAIRSASIIGKHDGIMSDELVDMLREDDE